MKDEEKVLSKINRLKKIKPDEDFRGSCRRKILAMCYTQEQQKQQKENIFSLSFFRISVFSGSIAMVLILGWQFILSPVSIEKKRDLDISSIRKEWKIANISPHLENIFLDEDIDDEIDSALNDLALANKEIKASDNIFDISNDDIIKEKDNMNLDDELILLGNGKIDRILEELSK